MKAGVPGLLMALIYVVVKGALKPEPTWVFGWSYREAVADSRADLLKMTADRDLYRDKVFVLIDTAHLAARTTKEAVTTMKEIVAKQNGGTL